jgi:uroporphyrinogen decarboxylase
MPEMTALERTLACVSHQEPDRVPIFPILLMQGARELGLPLPDYFANGHHLAQGQLALLKRYGHDCVIGVPHVVQDAAAFGCRLIHFPDGPPSLGSLVAHSTAELQDLRPPDPLQSPILRPTLDALEELAAAVKGKVPIIGACIAPFSLPSMLLGTEGWMSILFEPPEIRDPLLAQTLAVATDFVVTWANLQLEYGADMIVLADGMASATVIFRQQFIDHALPVVQKTIAAINGPVVYEGVGALGPFIDLMPETGAAAVILEHGDDLAACKAAVGDKITLVGNLNNIAMLAWTEADMEQQVKAAIDMAATGGGYILSAQGPEIPWDVPDELIATLINVGKTYGRYT